MNKTLLILAVLLLCMNASFAQKSHAKMKVNSHPTVPQYKLVVYAEDYALAYTLEYILTEDSLKIVNKAELVGEKDSMFFQKALSTSPSLKKIVNADMDKLKTNYSTPCVRDGSQVTVIFARGNKSKIVHLSNYYQPDIGSIIELINSLVPQKFTIWYDKKELTETMKRCYITK
ncbi:MAG: hypothetical protein ACTHJ0_11285 [Flavipsychrobacter sp.]